MVPEINALHYRPGHTLDILASTLKEGLEGQKGKPQIVVPEAGDGVAGGEDTSLILQVEPGRFECLADYVIAFLSSLPTAGALHPGGVADVGLLTPWALVVVRAMPGHLKAGGP